MEPVLQVEEDLDARIRELQDQLTRVRQERALLQLRNELAHEEQLLSHAQQQNLVTFSHLPLAVSDDPRDRADEWEQRVKRSDSEGTLANYIGNYPVIVPETQGLPVTALFRGVNRKEYLRLIARLEGHFGQWAQYYQNDGRKIAEARRHLAEAIGVKWALVELSEGSQTWQGFRFWLGENIRNKIPPDVAERRYRTARQRRRQSVSKFAAHLSSLEANLPRLVGDRERCQRLWDGVLPQVRANAPISHPGPYHLRLSQLCAAGMSLTRRR